MKVSEPEPPAQRPIPSSSPAPHDAGTRGPGGYRDRDERNNAGPGGYRGPGSYRGPGNYRDERNAGPGNYRGPGSYHNVPLTGSIVGGISSQRPRQPMEGTAPGRGPRPGGSAPGDRYRGGERKGGRPVAPRKPKASPAPRPRKEKIPPPEPFKPTPEQITQVEIRYRELAIPAEFDGIRTQIAQELSIPKKAVKQIVKALRDRESIPSWWETQTYKGDNEEKEKILAAYQPYLPVPPVGVHRKIADELDLKPGTIYQAIKMIRSELNLPAYNDPELHASEFEEIKRKAREAREAREAARAAQVAAQEAEQAATNAAALTTPPGERSAEAANAANQGVPVLAMPDPGTNEQPAEKTAE